MVNLSSKEKKRLDQAVLLGVTLLHESRAHLNNLYFSKPNRFSLVLLKFMLLRWPVLSVLRRVRDEIDQIEEDILIKWVENSLRRLKYRKEVRRKRFLVAVMLGSCTANYRVVKRQMSCYVPTTVLEEMARV